MQIVSNRDNLHDMSNYVFLEKKYENFHKFVVCWISPEKGKGYGLILWLLLFYELDYFGCWFWFLELAS